MNYRKSISCLAALFVISANTSSVHAITRRAKAAKASSSLAAVCPKIQSFNPSLMFWKNNKPLRASSAINAPVIGYYRQMTLGYNAGRRGPLGNVLYDSNGQTISSMVSYPCRADHCGGRVVSSQQTDTARRATISRTRNPRGYVALGRGVCVEIPDIGRCFGNEVNKARPLCNTTVG